MNRPKIRNIIFDLGNVVVDIDAQLTIDAFRKLGWSEQLSDPHHPLGSNLFIQFEKGSDSPVTFRENVRRLLRTSLSDYQIDEAWGAMIVRIPTERIRYLELLRSRYRIFLLSNTNEIHRIKFHRMFEEEFGYSFYELFEQNFYSHEMTCRKPEAEIYIKAMEMAGITASDSLFIDDIKENVEAAESVGINGLHIEAGTLLEALPDYLEKYG